jgi:hypothetical protein
MVAAALAHEALRREGSAHRGRRVGHHPALGIPCVKPPWDMLTAVDMEYGTIRWQVPLGGAPFVYTRVLSS